VIKSVASTDDLDGLAALELGLGLKPLAEPVLLEDDGELDGELGADDSGALGEDAATVEDELALKNFPFSKTPA